MSLFTELKRRNVFRIGIAYAVVSWLVLQVADVLIDNIGAPDWVFPTLLMVLGIGFPIALIFAWAFELTPEGLKRESEVDRETSITGQTGRKLDRAIIVVLTLAVAYLLVDKLVLDPRSGGPASSTETAAADEDGAAADGASVAVLPFVNMSNDPDNEYFSDGLTDTLLHMLAQLPDLRVAARTSSFAFKGQNKAVSEIADELGVSNILEGSVQRAGDQVRVTAQLIRAEDGFHIWSQNYTRPLQDIFAIQDEIATDVAQALGASLLGEDGETMHGVETTDLTAYDRYLKGLEQQAIFTYGSLETAQNHFEQALAEDPEFTDARLALVRNYLLKRLTGILTNEELNRVARPLIDQVIEHDPGNTLAQGYLHMLDGRFSGTTKTREEVRQAIYRSRDLLGLVPTDSFIRVSVAGGLHFMLDEPDAALAVLDAGLLIDPLDALLYIERGDILTDLERLDEAEAALLKAIELSPENPGGPGHMIDVELERGNLPAALEWMRKTMELDPQDHELPDEIARHLYALELPEAAEPYYARVQALAPGSAVARALEMIRADERGDTERAIAIAERMIEEQVDLRRGAFFQANLYYADLMLEAGRAREAHDFLLATRPDIADWSGWSADAHGNIMRYFAILLMTGFAESEERQSAWNQYKAASRATGFEFAEAGTNASIIDAIINGDIERSVSEQLEYRMTDSIADAPWRHRVIMRPLYEPMLSDPRMVAAMDARTREAATLRAEIQGMLLEPEWNP